METQWKVNMEIPTLHFLVISNASFSLMFYTVCVWQSVDLFTFGSTNIQCRKFFLIQQLPNVMYEKNSLFEVWHKSLIRCIFGMLSTYIYYLETSLETIIHKRKQSRPIVNVTTYPD